MRRIILTAIALTLFGGVASADHWRRGGGGRGWDRGWDRRSGGTVVVRDHRGGDWGRRVEPRRTYVRRSPVYVNNNRFVFGGGASYTYHRPVIRNRYFDVRFRPTLVVENYDPVPGYIWVQGHWEWNGVEWLWTSGYYSPDSSYDNYDPYYQPSSYEQPAYYDHDCD